MHPNPIYRDADAARCLAFAAEVGFGMLAVSSGGAPDLAHVPFVVTPGGDVELHLVRSNPVARAAQSPVQARLAVQGPHGYVSPDWYGMEHQVPTWNYAAVHLTGRLELQPQAEMRAMLGRLSEVFETRLLPKPVWRIDKMPEEAMERLLRMIQPFVLRVEGWDGTWKLSQNKPEAARLGAADGMAAAGPGPGLGGDTDQLSAMMRAWRDAGQ